MNCMCHHHSHECIARVPIFEELSEHEQKAISEITVEKTYKKGEQLYKAGDMFSYLMVLSKGAIKLSRIALNGKEQVTRIVRAGDFIGELSVLSNKPQRDFATILEDATVCIVEAERLKHLMNQQPSIAFKIMETLTNRLDNAEDIIQSNSISSPEERIAQKLLELADENNVVNLRISKKDFANMLSITQETLSRKLAYFQNKGFIHLDGQRKIILKDVQRLSDID